MRNERAGFTLVEMIVVVSILGLLLGMNATRSTVSLERSRDAALMTQLHHLRNAVHQYALDHQGRLPPELGALRDTYLKHLPADWTGGRSRGTFHYSPESGAISLFRADGTGPETLPDSKGRPYADY